MPPIVCDHDELCAGKNFMQISWLCISNSSQGLTPLDGLILISREMPYTNLTGLILKNLRGGTLNLFSLWRGKHTVSTEGGVG